MEALRAIRAYENELVVDAFWLVRRLRPPRRTTTANNPLRGLSRVLPYELRSSICSGLVCFIPLFDRVVALRAVVQPALANSTQDTEKHTLASEIPMMGVLNQ